MEISAKQSLSIQVEEQIQKDFFQGASILQPLLPSEKELCDKYHVSRITIREALRGLESRGFVRSIHGKGVACVNNSVPVAVRSLQSLIERNDISARELFDIRYTLERRAAGLAAIYAEKEDIDNLKSIFEQMRHYGDLHDYDQYLASDLLFHVYVARASKNLLLSCIVESMQQEIHDTIDRRTDHNMILDVSFNFHQRILQAIIRGDAEEAQKQMMRHLLTTDTLISDGANDDRLI